MENSGTPDGLLAAAHACHAFAAGTKSAATVSRHQFHRCQLNCGRRFLAEFTAKRTCNQASPDVAVMLHLRFRYVSKAAILTLPVQLVSVENRSPA
jgi:hypothetical protein